MSSVNKIQLEEMRARMKTLLVFYLACLAVLAFVCILMYRTTSYYATAYPYSNITALPHNSTTMMLSVFNGYSEKVPQGANLTYIMQNVGGIRKGAMQAVAATIEELLLAFATLMLFSVFSVILEERVKTGAYQSKKLYLLPVIFLIALLVSQYVVSFMFVIEHKTGSGISFFFVDSLAVIIWFGILDEFLMRGYARKATTAKAVKFLMVIWPLMLVLIVVWLLECLGLFAYNASFAMTYFVHSLGLLEFTILFALLYFWGLLTEVVRKVCGLRREAPMPRRTSKRSAVLKGGSKDLR
jgi:hypothetical protein